MTSEIFDLLCRRNGIHFENYCFMENGENAQPVMACSYDDSTTNSAGSEHSGRRGGSRKNVGGNGAEN
jgi:hypothetical protein